MLGKEQFSSSFSVIIHFPSYTHEDQP